MPERVHEVRPNLDGRKWAYGWCSPMAMRGWTFFRMSLFLHPHFWHDDVVVYCCGVDDVDAHALVEDAHLREEQVVIEQHPSRGWKTNSWSFTSPSE